MGGRGASKSCRTYGQDRSPHNKAADGARPIVPVLLHYLLLTLPAMQADCVEHDFGTMEAPTPLSAMTGSHLRADGGDAVEAVVVVDEV
jgi:hypothetical protein